jgi:hypothetical protein
MNVAWNVGLLAPSVPSSGDSSQQTFDLHRLVAARLSLGEGCVEMSLPLAFMLAALRCLPRTS